MRFTTLKDWLAWQETLHPEEIELGLDRVKKVFQSLHTEATPFKVITVAGTNGKGSSVSMLQSILLEAGYSVGAYTSPHILRYNERVCHNGQPVDDSFFINAFERIDQAREKILLTYFEFGTLAALDIFYETRPDIVLLEVGLGGRLDAVNIIDPDIALITSIDIDHTAWLGGNREVIAAEKAGIMRRQIPVVFSGTDMPDTIRSAAKNIDAALFVLNEDFQYTKTSSGWSWHDNEKHTMALPMPSLFGAHQLQNAAGVIKALKCLDHLHPVNNDAIRQGLLKTSLRGRFEVIPAINSLAERVFDVAHNSQALRQLSQNLLTRMVKGKTVVVIGMLADKDCDAAIMTLLPIVDVWFCGSIHSSRGLSAEKLAERLSHSIDSTRIRTFERVAEAYRNACEYTGIEDRIVITGSFITVAEVLEQSV
jgi:dihydrofolate synthase/folylpolyglutamate synthase